MAGLDPALLEEVRDALDGAREVIGRMPRAQAGTIAALRLHAAVESLVALCEDQERRLGWGAYAQGLRDGAGERAGESLADTEAILHEEGYGDEAGREGDAVGAPGAVVEPPASGAPSAHVSRETCCEDLGTDPCGEPATGTAFDREHGSYYPACDKHRREPVTEVPAPPGHHVPFRLVEDESLPPNTVVVRGAEGVVEHRFRLVAGKGEVRYWFEEAP